MANSIIAMICGAIPESLKDYPTTCVVGTYTWKKIPVGEKTHDDFWGEVQKTDFAKLDYVLSCSFVENGTERAGSYLLSEESVLTLARA